MTLKHIKNNYLVEFKLNYTRISIYINPLSYVVLLGTSRN